jgi:hypothetical protein
MSFLTGYKTYLVAAGMIAYQLIGYFVMGKPLDIQSILVALGLAGLRNGVANS